LKILLVAKLKRKKIMFANKNNLIKKQLKSIKFFARGQLEAGLIDEKRL